RYCGKCANQFQSPPTKPPSKPKKTMKKRKIKSQLKPKKKTFKKSVKKPTALALRPASRKLKNPLEYYECMKNCCLKKQKISQTARECKQNALVINSRLSVPKKKAVAKIRAGYRQMGAGLAEFIKANK